MNYFDLFQIPIQFKVNKIILEKKFYSLQKQYHPDIHQSKTLHHKKNSSLSSAVINEAYNILKNKFNRAKYLLKIYQKKDKNTTKNNSITKNFIKKQFQLYEIIESFKKKKKDIKKISVFIQKIKKKINYYFIKINQEFQQKKIYEIQKTLYNLFFKRKILLLAQKIKESYVK